MKPIFSPRSLAKDDPRFTSLGAHLARSRSKTRSWTFPKVSLSFSSRTRRYSRSSTSTERMGLRRIRWRVQFVSELGGGRKRERERETHKHKRRRPLRGVLGKATPPPSLGGHGPVQVGPGMTTLDAKKNRMLTSHVLINRTVAHEDDRRCA